MISELKSGDRVLLSSGIIGRVRRVEEATLIIQIAENTKVEVVRGAISKVLDANETPSEIPS